MDQPSIVVITGASRGLGRAAAHRMATDGYQVVATARSATDLASLCSKVHTGGHHIEAHALDVTDDASVAALHDWLAERFGRVDILINNAGILIDHFSTSVLALGLDDLRRTLDTNLIGMIRVTQALMPLMRASRAGRVVNLSSSMGQLAEMEAGNPAYRISKTAVNAFTRILAAEAAAAGDGVKVNAVCPGWVRTELGGANAPRSPEEGIDTVIWLATLPADGPNGGFFRDRQPIPW